LRTKESIPPVPPPPYNDVVDTPAEEDPDRKSSGASSIQENPSQSSQVDQPAVDTSRVSIQTDDMPIPGSFYRKDHAVQGDGGENHLSIPRWLPRWLTRN
jgi:hypothetical protein